MRRGWLTVALIASVFGMVCSGISLNNFINVQNRGVMEESFCSISDFIDCDVVEASSYASIKGVPIAGFGFIYYAFIFLFSAYVKFSRGFKRSTVAFAWWTTLPANLYAIFLSYISLVVLRTLCLTCVGMYIANLVLLISLYVAMNMPFSEGLNFLWGYWLTIFTRRKIGIGFMPKFGSHIVATIVIFVIGSVVVFNLSSKVKGLSEAEANEYVDGFYRQSKYDIKFNKDDAAMWGTKGAPVTIVEFSDYRCPFCKVSAFTIKPFLAEYKKDIAYYFVNYPLDSTCNHYMQHQMHPGACLGAKAGICANKAGKYWAFHDAIFRTTGRITEQLVMGLIKKLNIDEKEFVKCLNSSETEHILKEEIEASRRIYITGTPTIFINDRQLKFWKNPDILRTTVKREIKASKKAHR